LVENAIKHGIGPKIGGGEIRVSGRLAAERLTIVVEDTGSTEHVASRQRGTGIGLANIRERLQHLYGDAAAIQLEQNGLGGTRAVLTLPQLTGVPL
jgi:LytS/YehU family sensor histidine kinase